MQAKTAEKCPNFAKWRRRCIRALAGVILFIGILVALMQFAEPLVERNHARIELWLSAETGHQVRFERIRFQWSVVTPMIVLDEFAVKTQAQSQHWLQVKQMQFGINWWKSLIKRELRLGRWHVTGVDIDFANISPGNHQLDTKALFSMVTKWLGKNPVSVNDLAVHIESTEQSPTPVTLIFDELSLHQQRGTVTQLENPGLKPWLPSTQPYQLDDQRMKKRLRIQGRVHVQGHAQRKAHIVVESAPYNDDAELPDAKLFVDLQHFPLNLIPDTFISLDERIRSQTVAGKVWVEIQAGHVAAVQSIFHTESSVVKRMRGQPIKLSGHLYALKDADNGWWITAEKLRVKTQHQEPIEAKFAVQYRDVDSEDIQWLVRVPQFSFTQGDASLTGTLQWHQPRNQNSAYLKLHTSADDFPIQQIIALLPEQKVPMGLYAWLSAAPKSGVLRDTVIDIDGNINDILRGDSAAKVQGKGQLVQTELQYNPDWPSIKAEMVDFELQQNHLRFQAHQINTMQTMVEEIAVVVGPLFSTQQMPMAVDVTLTSGIALPQAKQYLQYTPLRKTVGAQLKDLDFKGNGRLAIQLHLPLTTALQDKFTLQGAVNFERAGLRLKSWPVLLNDLKGAVNFSESSLSSTALSGTLWGEPVKLTLDKQTRDAQRYTRIVAETTLALPALAKVFPTVDKLPMLGSTPATIQIDVPADQNAPIDLMVQSDLQGIHIALPAPIGKTTSERKNTVVQAQLGNQASNQYHMSYNDSQVVMRAHQISPTASTWEFDFDDDLVKGTAKLSLIGHQRILLGNFDKLVITQTEQPTNSETLNPELLPALQFTVKDFQLDHKRLGRLHLITQPIADGQEITKFQTRSAAVNIDATGKWLVKRGLHFTALNGSLSSSNFKRALRALDLSPSLESDKSYVEYSLNWPGAPYQFQMKQLNGSAYFKLQEGRVPNISKQTSQMIGIGKMINLLSVASIPKRLRLDFSDVTEKGLHFDSFKGKVLISHGNASTNDAVLEGPVARIRWKGHVGLGVRDYDLIMRVEPHMTSSLPLVAAIAGGPVVGPVAGVATWMVNKAIAPDIERMSSYTYEIIGPWIKPNVRSIDPTRLTHSAPVVDRS